LLGIALLRFVEKPEQMPKKLKKSSALRSIPGIVTSDSGIVTSDSGNTPEIGHDQTESAVTFRRNQRSRLGRVADARGDEPALARHWGAMLAIFDALDQAGLHISPSDRAGLQGIRARVEAVSPAAATGGD
jgi:hypothetical protein